MPERIENEIYIDLPAAGNFEPPGNAAAGYPDIGGQPSGYTIAQLTAYREGERSTDENVGGMMRGVARGLTDKEIAALADYVQGLH